MNLPIAPEHLSLVGESRLHETTIKLEDVSVRYRAPEERVNTFKEYAIRRLKQQVVYRDFWALHNINLEIYKGEIFGIIGRNGAGKSTLLKVISRVVAPTEGRVWVKGHISPLLELGAGFHPELTGIENIFLNGTILGHTRREIETKLNEILDFAEIGGFIDAPLRTYSSGMVARLGFAVATAWQPEILVLDELLAVGDEAFRSKCRARMEDFRVCGTTILLATHDMDAARALCSRAVWLDRGLLQMVGIAKEVIESYANSSSNT